MSEPSGWKWPAKGYYKITQDYMENGHTGIDISAPEGATIRAVDGGKVTFAGADDSGYGNLVKVQHDYDGDTYTTYYAHLLKIYVKKGDELRGAGESVGEADSTGNSTGNHLHFELRKGNTVTSPWPYLNEADDGPSDKTDPDPGEGEEDNNGGGSGLGDLFDGINLVNVVLILVGIAGVFIGLTLLSGEVTLRAASSIIGESLGSAIKGSEKA